MAHRGHGMYRPLRSPFNKNDLLTKKRPITLICIASFSVLEPAKTLPAYFILSLFISSGTIYTSVTGRPVSVSVAKALGPATWTVYAVAFMLLCIVPNIQKTNEGFVVCIWRLLPASIPVLVQTLSLSSAAREKHSSDQAATDKTYMAAYYNKDYPLLVDWYRIILVLNFLANASIPASSYHEKALITSSIVAHCLQRAFQLRYLGYATTQQTAYAVLAILFGTLILGPMTIYSGFWYWRETVICSLSK